MQSEQINELAAALSKAQGSMANAVMNKTNPHFKSKYADLSSVLDAIRAPLSANGLSVAQTMQLTERGMVLRTTLMHASGQSISTEYPLPATQRPHEMGSALTYARRYSLAALICNSADEDDDGNSAMAAKPTNGAAKKSTHDTLPEDIGPVSDEEILKKDHSIQTLTVDEQRPIFAELEAELGTCETVDDCKRWGVAAKSRASRLSGHWRKTLAGRYLLHLRQIETRDADEYVENAAK